MLPLHTYMYVAYHTVYHDLPSAALFLPPSPDSNAAADPYWFGRVFLLHAPLFPLMPTLMRQVTVVSAILLSCAPSMYVL